MLGDADTGTLLIGDDAVPWTLRRSRKRRTLGLTVTHSEIRIHAPHYVGRLEIEAYVLRQRDWLRRAWARQRTHSTAHAPTDSLRYLGQTLAWRVSEAARPAVRRVGRELHIDAPPGADPTELALHWLHERAHRMLTWRLMRQARHARRQPAKVGLSNAKSLWGSCTARGTIRLNWRLAQAPLHLIDYVAAHELAHLVHLDHSPRFWAEVERLCDEPLAKRAALRAMGTELFRW